MKGFCSNLKLLGFKKLKFCWTSFHQNIKVKMFYNEFVNFLVGIGLIKNQLTFKFLVCLFVASSPYFPLFCNSVFQLSTLVAVTSNPICQVMSHHDVSFELSKSYAIFFFPAKRVKLSIFSAKCL